MLDLAKAFDSVDKEMPWQILLSRGAPPKLVNLIRDLHTHHSPVICSKVDSAPQVLDSCRDVCLLHPYSISVVTQSFASYSCRGICYKIQGQIVHCKNLRCCCEFCCMLMTFPWHVTPLRSSGKLSPPQGLTSSTKKTKVLIVGRNAADSVNDAAWGSSRSGVSL